MNTQVVSSLHKRLAREEDLCELLIGLLYPGKMLPKLATRVGLSFPGHRIDKIPRDELIDALADAVRTGSPEGQQVVQEMTAAAQAEREEIGKVRTADLWEWVRTAPDAQQGARRLVAALADKRESIARSAAQWCREQLARYKAGHSQTEPLAPVLDLLMDMASAPVAEAADAMERVVKQLRQSARSLEDAASRQARERDRLAAELGRGLERLGGDLSRLRSWTGEQQAQIRTALEALTTAVRRLEERLDRHQAAVEELIARVGGIAVALDRGRTEAARRELARLRAGPRRVGIFADVANLDISARQAHAARVQYRALRERGGWLGQVTLARAYVAVGPETQAQRSFHTALEHAGFEVRALAVKQLADGRFKANWDLGMATDMMRHAESLDVVVLASGDGDFLDLVHWLRQQGLQVHVAGVTGHTAQDLIAAADGWIPLEGDLLSPLPR